MERLFVQYLLHVVQSALTIVKDDLHLISTSRFPHSISALDSFNIVAAYKIAPCPHWKEESRVRWKNDNFGKFNSSSLLASFVVFKYWNLLFLIWWTIKPGFHIIVPIVDRPYPVALNCTWVIVSVAKAFKLSQYVSYSWKQDKVTRMVTIWNDVDDVDNSDDDMEATF